MLSRVSGCLHLQKHVGDVEATNLTIHTGVIYCTSARATCRHSLGQICSRSTWTSLGKLVNLGFCLSQIPILICKKECEGRYHPWARHIDHILRLWGWDPYGNDFQMGLAVWGKSDWHLRRLWMWWCIWTYQKTSLAGGCQCSRKYLKVLLPSRSRNS